MPKVSVIVPIYNVEKYLSKSLETLVNQTLQEIEIILVNDGSQDESGKIAKQYQEKYPEKIKYFEKQNGGLSDSRNYGMKYATGEYIAFLDSDDYVELNIYEDMYKIAQKEQSDMVQCNFYWEYPKKRKEGKLETYNNSKEMIEKGRVEAWNKLIKREIIKENKIEFPKGYRYEDVEFTYKLAPYIKKVSFLQKPYIHYIQRQNSISNLQNEKTKEIFGIFDNIFEFYKEKGLYQEYKTELEYIYAKTLFCSSFVRMVKIPDKQIRKELINQTFENVNTKFPQWKKNEILNKNKTLKNLYIKSFNKITYKIYSKILRIKEQL